MPEHRSTVGIDVGKDHLDVASLPTHETYRVYNDPSGHAASVARLRAAGKPAKVALTACMRKLLTILKAIAKTGRGWEPRPIHEPGLDKRRQLLSPDPVAAA